MGARFGTRGEVPLEGARIAGDVLGIAELQRVDEDGDGDDVALFGGPGDERPVSVVQRAHRRYEADGAAGGAGCVEQVAAAGGGLDDVHDASRPAGTDAVAAAAAVAVAASLVARAAPAW